MASEFSFDVVSHFDLQELRNAVDQVKREATTRYDLKDFHAEIDLQDEMIVITAPGESKVKAIYDVLLQKVINRKLSPKILDAQKPLPTSGDLYKMEVKLLKAMDQEMAKVITKMLKDNFPKVKGSIQGSAVRVSSKDKDNLQAVITYLRTKEGEFKLPLEFENYR